MRSIVIRLAATAAVIYALLVTAAYFGQRSLVFAPSAHRASPSHGFGEVALNNAAGETLYSWYKPARDGQPTYLFMHGNGGSIGGRAGVLNDLSLSGFGVFAVGYPGYGGSEGQPSEPGLIEAAQLAYDFLANEGVGADELILFGVSLGSAVAVQLAASNPSAAVVLFAPMNSIVEIGQNQYPILPVDLLMKDRFESYRFVGSIDAPLLIVHGTRDRLIPPESSRVLFSHAAEPKRYHALEGAGHNNLFSSGAMAVVRPFVDDVRHARP